MKETDLAKAVIRHKRNKLRNHRRRVAELELDPPRATYRNKKKLERRRKALIRFYQAKAATAGMNLRPAPAPEPEDLFSRIGAAMARQIRKRLEAKHEESGFSQIA